MKLRCFVRWLIPGCAVLVLSCKDAVRPDGTGSIRLQIVVSPELPEPGPARSPGAVASHLDSAFAVAVGPVTKGVKLTKGATSFTGTIADVSVGAYTVIVWGFAGDGVDYYGQTGDVSVQAGVETRAIIDFQSFVPTITLPAATTWSFRPGVTINPVAYATSYIIEVDRSNTFPSPTKTTVSASGTASVTVSDTGTYYLRVRADRAEVSASGRTGRAGATQTVRIVTDLRPSGTTPASAVNLGFLAPTAAFTLDSLNIFPATDDDWFLISDCNGDSLTVTAQAVRLSPASPLNSALQIFSNATGRLLAQNDNADSTDARIGIRMSADGSYQLRVRGSNSTVGHYKLAVAATGGANNNVSSCKVLAFPVNAVSTGLYHTCAASSSGRVDCWGYNQYGQLGDGTTITRSSPARTSGASLTGSVTTGAYHSCALTGGGQAYCWGLNGNGQLGDGTTTDRTVPTAVSGALTFGVIAAGDFFACGLTSGGQIYCWGGNAVGQLGNGSNTPSSSPVLVSGGLSWSYVSAGARHACGLTTGNLVYCWGFNSSGQLGNGSTTDANTPQLVGGPYSTFRAGGYHACALSLGTAYCWGRNDLGQLGNGTTANALGPTAVSGGLSFYTLDAGRFGTCGIVGSTLYCWGNNFDGQVGDGTTALRTVPVPAATATTFVMISAGGYHACAAATSSLNLYCWGWNGFGQVGDATALDGVSPVLVTGLSQTATTVTTGHEHSCALLTGGSVYCWGWNSSGQLGDGTTTDHTAPGLVTGFSDFQSVSGGSSHTCGIRGTNLIYCWGDNTYGQLGNGTTTPSSSPTPAGGPGGYAVVSTGDDHTCALTTAPAAYCWGDNPDGRVGNNTTVQQNSPVAVSGGLVFSKISAGGLLSCGVTVGGAAYCWGDNGAGGLGTGNTTSSSVPVRVSGTQTWSNISAGYDYACGLTTSSTAYCWGNNGDGQLGIGSSANSSVPALVTGGLTWKAVSAGRNGTACGITTSNVAYCWGINITGQVGDGTYTYRNAPTPVLSATLFQAIQAGDYHTCGVSGTSTSGAVFCWGNNERGELGYTPTTIRTTPVAVVTGPAAAPGILGGEPGFSSWRPLDGAPVVERTGVLPGRRASKRSTLR